MGLHPLPVKQPVSKPEEQEAKARKWVVATREMEKKESDDNDGGGGVGRNGADGEEADG